MRFARAITTFWLCAAGSVSLTGCNDEGFIPRQKPAAERTGILLAKPPKLPKKWSDMEAADWKKHLTDNAIHFPANLEHRSGSRDCALIGESSWCKLSITPVADAGELSKADIDTDGVLLAVIVNTGILKEKTLGLQPWDEVYWIAYRTPSGTWESALVDFKKKGVKVGSIVPYHECPNREGESHQRRTYAEFKYCNHDRPRAADHHTSPPWISCIEGCCVAGG